MAPLVKNWKFTSLPLLTKDVMGRLAQNCTMPRDVISDMISLSLVGSHGLEDCGPRSKCTKSKEMTWRGDEQWNFCWKMEFCFGRKRVVFVVEYLWSLFTLTWQRKCVFTVSKKKYRFLLVRFITKSCKYKQLQSFWGNVREKNQVSLWRNFEGIYLKVHNEIKQFKTFLLTNMILNVHFTCSWYIQMHSIKYACVCVCAQERALVTFENHSCITERRLT